MKMDYYVYGLIDPRNNQYFYIGKGKGKRYLSHMNHNKIDSNKPKLDRIKEIQDSNLEVGIEILFPDLDEETSFELEKIIIYKLGRQIVFEGSLTNMIPGGVWEPGDPMLYDKSYDTNFNLDRLDFVSKEKFLSIKKISDFDYLNNSSSEQILYIYDKEGNFVKEESIEGLFLLGPSERSTQILKEIRENELPVLSQSTIRSKYFKEKIYISNKIPYRYDDVIDEKFNVEFDKMYEKQKMFSLECFVDGILRNRVIRDNDLITLESYYTSGGIKSIQRYKGKEKVGEQIRFYQNGNQNDFSEYTESGTRISMIRYYKSGKIRTFIFHLGNGKRQHTQWSESGEEILNEISD